MPQRPTEQVEGRTNSLADLHLWLADLQLPAEMHDSIVAHLDALGNQVQQLEEGLETRTMIGQATGLLMAQEGLTSQEAFQRLVKISQTSNVKLREIAQKYVTDWEMRSSS